MPYVGDPFMRPSSVTDPTAAAIPDAPSIRRAVLRMRLQIVHGLKRLKCRLVGHALDTLNDLAWQHHPIWWCMRCHGAVDAYFGRLSPRRIRQLKKAGWNRDDLNSVGHTFAAVEDMQRFFVFAMRAKTFRGDDVLIRTYEEGFRHGYDVGARVGFPGDVKAVARSDGKLGIFPH